MPININPVPSLLGNVATGLEAFIGGYGSGYGGKSAQMQQSGQARIDAFKPMQAAQVQTQGFLHDLAYQQQAQNFRMQMQNQANANSFAKQDDHQAFMADAQAMKMFGMPVYPHGWNSATNAAGVTTGTVPHVESFNQSVCPNGQCGVDLAPKTYPIQTPQDQSIIKEMATKAATSVQQTGQLPGSLWEVQQKYGLRSVDEAGQFVLQQRAKTAHQQYLEKNNLVEEANPEWADLQKSIVSHPEYTDDGKTPNARGQYAMATSNITPTRTRMADPPPRQEIWDPGHKTFLGYQTMGKNGPQIHYLNAHGAQAQGDQPAQPQLPPGTMLNPETGFVDKIVRGPAYAADGMGPPAQARIIPGNLSPTAYEIEYNKLSDGTRPTKKDKEGRWEYPSTVPVEVAQKRQELEIIKEGNAATQKRTEAQLAADKLFAQHTETWQHQRDEEYHRHFKDHLEVLKGIWNDKLVQAGNTNPGAGPMLEKLTTDASTYAENRIEEWDRRHPRPLMTNPATPPPSATQPAAGEIRVINGRRYRWDAATGTGVPVGG